MTDTDTEGLPTFEPATELYALLRDPNTYLANAHPDRLAVILPRLVLDLYNGDLPRSPAVEADTEAMYRSAERAALTTFLERNADKLNGLLDGPWVDVVTLLLGFRDA